MKERRHAVDDSPLEGLADQRNETLGRELLTGDERPHVAQIPVAVGCELGAWGKFKVPEPVKHGGSALDDSGLPMGTIMEDGGREAGCKGSSVRKMVPAPGFESQHWWRLLGV